MADFCATAPRGRCGAQNTGCWLRMTDCNRVLPGLGLLLRNAGVSPERAETLVGDLLRTSRDDQLTEAHRCELAALRGRIEEIARSAASLRKTCNIHQMSLTRRQRIAVRLILGLSLVHTLLLVLVICRLWLP